MLQDEHWELTFFSQAQQIILELLLPVNCYVTLSVLATSMSKTTTYIYTLNLMQNV